jgi:transposase
MVVMARNLGLLAEKSRAAIDATGLESRHVSRYFVWRQGGKHKFSTYPKLTVVCDLDTHLLLGFYVCQGPCVDSPQFKPAIKQAVSNQPIEKLLGDKGYDAEHNHRLCREQLGIASTVIAVRRNTNGTRRWPHTPYRREMKHVAARVDYGQRWQVESAFSRHKRRFGSALRARTWRMQKSECALRVLTHNLMLLAAA